MELGLALIVCLIVGSLIVAILTGARFGLFAGLVVLFILIINLLDVALHSDRFNKSLRFNGSDDFMLGLAGGFGTAMLLLLAWAVVRRSSRGEAAREGERQAPPSDGQS
jgi:hypothetical protein